MCGMAGGVGGQTVLGCTDIIQFNIQTIHGTHDSYYISTQLAKN